MNDSVSSPSLVSSSSLQFCSNKNSQMTTMVMDSGNVGKKKCNSVCDMGTFYDVLFIFLQQVEESLSSFRRLSDLQNLDLKEMPENDFLNLMDCIYKRPCCKKQSLICHNECDGRHDSDEERSLLYDVASTASDSAACTEVNSNEALVSRSVT
uniref:BTB domain-containing protein n=1 Tax=Syphacia muris TaxID=451379 RepID=A0A0N5AZB4_9BILA